MKDGYTILNVHDHPGGNPSALEKHTWLGFDYSVILAGKGGNEKTLDEASRSGGKVFPFIFPDVDDLPSFVSRLEEYKRRGAKGLKFQPLTMRMEPDDEKLYPLYEKASELRLPCLFHTGVVAFDDHRVRYGNPLFIDQVAWDFPDLPVIIAHLGGNYSFEALVILEAHDNVYADTDNAETQPDIEFEITIETVLYTNYQ